jgi:hypothetical protein
MTTLIAESLGTIQPPTAAYSEGSAEGISAINNLEGFISAAIGMLTILAGVFFIFYFILGAFKWLSAGGDSGKVQKARDQIVQGVIGLIVVVAAYAIIGLIGTVLGLRLLTPGAVINELITLQ